MAKTHGAYLPEDLELLRGPALRHVSLDEPETVEHLAREQAAYALMRRRERMWDSFGNPPEASDRNDTLYGSMAGMALVPAGLLAAGFGFELFAAILLVAGSIAFVPYWRHVVRARKRRLRWLEDLHELPAILIGYRSEEEQGHRYHLCDVLLAGRLTDAADLRALVDLAQELEGDPRVEEVLSAAGFNQAVPFPFATEPRLRLARLDVDAYLFVEGEPRSRYMCLLARESDLASGGSFGLVRKWESNLRPGELALARELSLGGRG